MGGPMQGAGGPHAGHAHASKFACPGCGGAFATETGLKSHEASVHPMPSRPT